MTTPTDFDTSASPIVDAGWLGERIEHPLLRVVDATVHLTDHGPRSGREAWRAAHVPGSVFADLLGELAVHEPYPLAIPPAETFALAMGALGVGDGHTIVVYDNVNNMWAARLWWMLRRYGAERVLLLDGGLQSWIHQGRTPCDAPCRYPPAAFTPRPRDDVIVRRTELIEALDDPAVTIVDALDEDHFRGKRADYGRPGHLPGAINIPAEDLIDRATGRLLPPRELRTRFEPALSAPRVVTYCGAGVAAATAALVLCALGQERAAVYDGSLFEWAADPDLPLETAALSQERT